MTQASLSFPDTARISATGDSARGAKALLRLLLKPYRRLLLRQALEALPDRLLADIGIERSDLSSVVRKAT